MTTTYTIHNHWGMELFSTTDATEAESFSERGCIVTARAGGAT